MRTLRKNLAPIRHRRQYQRDFMNWLEESRDQFVVEPLKPRATVHYVRLRFPNMTPVLSLEIRCDSIMVIVTWRKQFFDIILELDMYPVWDGNAYRCGLCEDSKRTFQSLAAMRKDHLYKPFLQWCNEQFLTSRWLKMVMAGGSTGATLIRDSDSPEADAVTNLLLGLKKLSGQQMFNRGELQVFHLPVFDTRD